MDEMVARLFLFYSVGGLDAAMDYAAILDDLGLINPIQECIIQDTITELIKLDLRRLDQRRKEGAADVSGSNHERDCCVVGH